MFKLNMKSNPLTLAAFVLVLAALYMTILHKPQEREAKSVRFVGKKDIVQNRPAPAHTQADPNERVW
tara:strand:+ start:14492 stop:14692 length:201 start_codon:yes stop_codon:yes gene_type:complete